MIGKCTSYLDKPMATITAGEMGQLISEAAKRSNSYALDLVAAGIRKDLKAKDIRHLIIDGDTCCFKRNGKMTKQTKDCILETINLIFGTSSNKEAERVTIGQFIDKMLELDYLKKDIQLDAMKKGIKVLA